jgi:hypothetical protein
VFWQLPGLYVAVLYGELVLIVLAVPVVLFELVCARASVSEPVPATAVTMAIETNAYPAASRPLLWRTVGLKLFHLRGA